MGVSASSLLDDATSATIRGQVEAELREFSPYYMKQFTVAWFAQVEDELEQNKEKITQLLKQKEAPEEGMVLYEEGLLYFDENRKWRERYVVVRANYCLECHESLQSFVKGVPPIYKLLPTGGTVLTTEERYMEMVDSCYPDDNSVKEEFAPPLSGMPGQFPVYLRLPYRRDSYFCFRQQAKQAAFLSILSDCIKHQNQDFLKKKTCEVQAFLKAIQLYRQDRDKYQVWDMLIGSDVRVMANMVMEKLLPLLSKDLLPHLKAKKTEKKKVWFSTIEAAYFLVQERLLEGLSALKEECRTSAQQLDVLMRSDMDQILNTRRQLEEKVRAKVSEPAEQLCSESVQPFLGSMLEELMDPISAGFLEGQQLIETKMNQVCEDVQSGVDNEALKKALAEMARPNLLSCYHQINSVQDRLQNLQERFGFCTSTAVIHRAQIDLQQLVENAAYTFELMLKKAVEENPETAGTAVEKAKHRVLKQYDYDSSTVRKRIFQDALVSITLPFIKKNLADSCKAELQGLESTIYADYSSFIHIENVYENILLQILDEEVSKVVKEAAALKKHNLSVRNSRSSLSSVSTPGSPAQLPTRSTSQTPPSPLSVNGLPLSPGKEADQPQEKLEPTEDPTRTVGRQAEEPVQTVKVEESSKEELKTDVQPETAEPAEIQETSVLVQVEEPESAAEPETQKTEGSAENTLAEPSAAAESQASEAPVLDGTNEPIKPAAEDTGSQPAAEETGSQPAAASEETDPSQNQNPGIQLEAPPGGEGAEDSLLRLKVEESISASDPNSMNVSVGSDSPRSDLESTTGTPETSEILDVVESAGSPEEPSEDQTSAGEPSSEVQTEAAGAGAAVESPAEPSDTPSSPEGSGVQPLDCVKEIRNLVVEVIEVEEPLQRYPKEE
ncbi:PREDICTED: protein Niban [Cyprinodon variegatus]|uniref:Niban apoptosis regulator 1a n=1 Tax=Cyprinodon variegatus TaxID=28743 RepID=A0A3Q2CWA1_CYPVA|nr:PREDICTED: protein Niban [Cyprinodon variegatus]